MQCVSNLRQLAVIATSVASETGFYPPMLSQTTNSGGGLEHTGNFNPSPTSGGDKAATFASPLTLPGGGVYNVSFLVESNSGSGHCASFNALEFKGAAAIPEPATALFGALGLLRRRR